MPILWRYLLGHYLKIFTLSIVAFIILLLVTRLDEVAQFATLGASFFDVIMFALFQLPYILPIAVPISCLIASIILFKNLSNTHELAALRAAGNSLKNIVAPIVIAGSILALGNFYIISELSTFSHLSTRRMKNEMKSVNPILLLQNSHLLRARGAYVNVLGALSPGEEAHDVIFAMKNKHNSRLYFMAAKRFFSKDSTLGGDNVTIISHSSDGGDYDFDPFVIENIGSFSNPIEEFSLFMNSEGWRLNNDHLSLRFLIIKAREELEVLRKASSSHDDGAYESVSFFKSLSNSDFSKILSEILRRVSVAIAVFTFTFMGAAFGVDIGRNPSRRGIAVVIALATLYLAAFFAAMSLGSFFGISATLYLVPHIIIIALSFWTLSRITRGIE
ncbi:MAG: YjgP/YjgQ family permease [Waddliaceae bacterium]|nr:YjgP/YjgQ family permease [Waddliaceae bacterium]MBT3579116.1 YjgP/YjgQ family permease [Waddliaceae bacterium]MBT4444909.1 YjgP/YjgQ family permease [Waddliaceae bacterium]MBT6927938.1 YjgP/YjgQ family permease [Waddliaceae bacterium]MBT7264804.1 YjgP/YjgQ family permease [Waddliaceae bacterium]